MRWLILPLLLLPWLSIDGAQEGDRARKTPRTHLLMINGWPGEGRPVFRTGKEVESLILLSEPGERLEPSVVRLASLQKLEWDDSRILVLQEGEFEMGPSTPQELTLVSGLNEQGNLVYEHTGTLKLSPGERIRVLCYRAEGFYLFEHKGQMFEMFAEDAGRFLRKPVVEWWIRIKLSEGTSGWVRVDGEIIETIERTY